MDRKRISILLIICLANALIYTLPYLQSTYYDSMMAAYGYSHVQMGNLISVYGGCNIVAYLFGGVAADAIDTKKLFVFSLAATGLSGLYAATLPSYPVMLAISIFWSVSTVLTFWPAMLKAVKSLAEGAHQGQVFGFKETMCCIIAFVFSMLALGVFRLTEENFVMLIIFYSVSHLVVAVLVALFMPSMPADGKPDVKTLIRGIGKVIHLKGVWLIGMTIFFGQLFAVVMGRFTPFLTSVVGMSASTVALITIIGVNGLANIGSVSGGKISDYFHSPAKFISFTMVAGGILSVIFLMVPWSRNTAVICVAISLVFRIFHGALKSVFFATMSQVDIPRELTGTASGVISVIGYMPDMFGYTLCGAVMQSFETLQAYRIIFIGLIVVCAAGSITATVLHKYSKKLRSL
ncbi:MAG: MFS transporter [Oscillospiraceae bacterium]|nr:MFS transporter [Oscillospiraceae bacterium]